MDQQQSLAMLRGLAASGVELVANVETVWGGETFLLTPEQALVFMTDRDSVAAEHFGVMKEDYRDWLAAGGHLRCEAQTVRGRQCKAYVPGGQETDPAKWVSARRLGGRCAVHGG